MNGFYNPVWIHEGIDCIRNLRQTILTHLGEEARILLLGYSEAVLSGKPYQRILDQLVGMKVFGMACPVENPGVNDVYRVYQETKNREINLIVAVGGGSILDLAKVLCCLYGCAITDEEMLRSVLAREVPRPAHCRWIGIPTTQGSGSEATCTATVWDPPNDACYKAERSSNFALAAFVDPSFAAGMPLPLAVAGALDSLCHGIEAYWTPDTSPLTDLLALKAVATIRSRIASLATMPNHQVIMEAMAQGSLLAGMAHGGAGATACHILADPMTLRLGIPHGIAVGMLLTQMAQHSWYKVKNIEALEKALGIKAPKGVQVIVHSVLERADIPIRLRDWGADQKDLQWMAEQTAGRLSSASNPVKLEQKDVLAMLNRLY